MKRRPSPFIPLSLDTHPSRFGLLYVDSVIHLVLDVVPFHRPWRKIEKFTATAGVRLLTLTSEPTYPVCVGAIIRMRSAEGGPEYGGGESAVDDKTPFRNKFARPSLKSEPLIRITRAGCLFQSGISRYLWAEHARPRLVSLPFCESADLLARRGSAKMSVRLVCPELNLRAIETEDERVFAEDLICIIKSGVRGWDSFFYTRDFAGN